MAQRPILWYSFDAVTAAMLLSSLLACNPRLAPAAMLLSLLLWHSASFTVVLLEQSKKKTKNITCT
jgi:hypothetical protein